MKVSTKGRYGLRILLDIALHETGGKPRMIREIAVNQEISEKYIRPADYRAAKSGIFEIRPRRERRLYADAQAGGDPYS